MKEICFLLLITMFLVSCSGGGSSSGGGTTTTTTPPATTTAPPTTTTTVPPSVPQAIQSVIISNFSGLNYGNFYELQNGQIWKQTESWIWVWVWVYPKVIIYNEGVWKMKVENIDHPVTVERIK